MLRAIRLRAADRWFVLSAISAFLAGLTCCTEDRSRAWLGRRGAASLIANAAANDGSSCARPRQAAEPHQVRSNRRRVRRARPCPVVARCVRRASRWRMPPNWSRGDWRVEAESLAALAAIEAEQAFDARVGVPRDAFVYRRILSALIARFRSEWSHARVSAGAGRHAANRRSQENPEERSALLEALGLLPDGESWLLRRLYGDQATESALAHEMGITQQAVSKRKRAAIARLRREICARNITQFADSWL